MKNKVINLFDHKSIVQNNDVKYSDLLEQFLTPFAKEFDDVEFYEDIIDFAINAWNFGNMKLILPEGETDAIVNTINDQHVDADLLKRMIDFKIEKFYQYPNFIVDYEVGEKDGAPLLKVLTQEEDAYLESMLEAMEDDQNNDNFEENFINRTAIILQPLQPFLDWFANLYPDEINEVGKITTYLIDVENDDVEGWLKKKYDKLFMLELDGWHTNKKEWPQKRNYKMFKQWFRVELSTLVYDLEKEPIIKGL